MDKIYIIPAHKRTIFLQNDGNIFVQFPPLRMEFKKDFCEDICLFVSSCSHFNLILEIIKPKQKFKKIVLCDTWPICLGPIYKGKLNSRKVKTMTNKFFNSGFSRYMFIK